MKWVEQRTENLVKIFSNFWNDRYSLINLINKVTIFKTNCKLMS